MRLLLQLSRILPPRTNQMLSKAILKQKILSDTKWGEKNNARILENLYLREFRVKIFLEWKCSFNDHSSPHPYFDVNKLKSKVGRSDKLSSYPVIIHIYTSNFVVQLVMSTSFT